MDLVKLIYGSWSLRVARRVLVGRLRGRRSPEKGRFTRSEVDDLVEAAWRRYGDEAAQLLPLPTLGATMNVRLASFTLAVLTELLAIGVEREYAIELVADASWGIYRTWGRLASAAARLAPGKTAALGFAASAGPGGVVSLRFPFNAPGYAIEAVPVDHGTAFDVVHCPIADYFRVHGAVDLCVASWCNLDYPLGEMTHQKLVRTKTLVQGADRCDFRVVPVESVLAHSGNASAGRNS
jgi:hypothetical protein